MAKILMITWMDIFNTKSGAQANSRAHYEMITNLFGEERVFLAMLGRKVYKERNICSVGRSNNKLSQFIRSFYGNLRGMNKKAEKRIINYFKEINPEYVFCDFSAFGTLIKKMKKINKNTKFISFFHDVDSDFEWNRVKNDSFLFLPFYFSSLYQEKRCIKYSDKLVCLNKRDFNRIKEKYNCTCDYVLPVSLHDEFKSSVEQKGKINESYFLFVGAVFPPNVDGMIWYDKNVAPFLKHKTKIVGRNFETLKDKFTSTNIEVVGSVEDLSSYYQNALAIVEPIRYGNGMKVKTAEALMFGKTIIGTNEAFEGYEITNEKEGYMANSSDDFINILNNNNFDLFNESSRKLFEDIYSYDANAKIINQIFND